VASRGSRTLHPRAGRGVNGKGAAAAAPPALREVRRGESADELELIDSAGNVVLLRAHGVHDDERFRTRERWSVACSIAA